MDSFVDKFVHCGPAWTRCGLAWTQVAIAHQAANEGRAGKCAPPPLECARKYSLYPEVQSSGCSSGRVKCDRKADNIFIFNKSVLRNTGLVAFDPTSETEIPES